MSARLVQDNPSQNTLTVDMPLTQDVSYFTRFSMDASQTAYRTSQAFGQAAHIFRGLTRMDVVNKGSHTRVSLVWGTHFWSDQEKQKGLSFLSAINQLVIPQTLADTYPQLGLPDPERVMVQFTNAVLAKQEIQGKFEQDGGEFILNDVVVDGGNLVVKGIMFGSCADCAVSEIATLSNIGKHIEFELLNRFKKTSPFDKDPNVQRLQHVKMQPLTVKGGFFIPR